MVNMVFVSAIIIIISLLIMIRGLFPGRRAWSCMR